MRRWLFAVLLLLVAVPVEAITRRPRVLLAVETSDTGSPGRPLAQMFTAMAEKHGIDVTTVTSPLVPPLIKYTQGLAGNWSMSQNFDALVIAGWNWRFTITGDARFDSLSRVGKYPTIPTLILGTRNGFDASSGVCSLGVAATSFVSQSGFYRATTTGRTFVNPTAGTTYTQRIVTYADGSLSTILTAPSSGTDTVFVWHRAVGAGITIMGGAATDVGEATMANTTDMAFAVSRWLQDFPVAIRPTPRLQMALHIDDGWKRAATGGGAIAHSDTATVRANADLLQALGVKYTVGVEMHADTLGLVDAGGYSRLERDRGIWEHQGLSKFTPHCHAGVNQLNGSQLASVTGGWFDLFGASRARDCTSTSTTDTSLYSLNRAALIQLESIFGKSQIDYCVMAPTDDYSPLNINSALCPQDGVFTSLRRAGYKAIRLARGGSPHYNTGDPSGYHVYAGNAPTDGLGNIRLIAMNHKGYLPGSSDGNALSDANRRIYFNNTMGDYFIGSPGYLQAISGGGGQPHGYSGIIVQHAINYAAGGNGLTVIQDVDAVMDSINEIWGKPVWRWVWSDQLSPITRP